MLKCIFGRRALVIYCLVRLGRFDLTVCIVSSIYSSLLSSIMERFVLLMASMAASSAISFVIFMALDDCCDDNDCRDDNTSEGSWEALGPLLKPVFS